MFEDYHLQRLPPTEDTVSKCEECLEGSVIDVRQLLWGTTYHVRGIPVEVWRLPITASRRLYSLFPGMARAAFRCA